MLKNVYFFIILLLFTTFISKSAPDTVAQSKHIKQEEYFTKVINAVRYDLSYKLLILMQSIKTLPAFVSRTVADFIDRYIEIAGRLDDIGIRIQFYLYTPANPYEVFRLELSYESFHNSTFNPSLETKFLIHGYGDSLLPTSIMYDIKYELLQKGNYNIIVVDWTRYNINYNVAAMNTGFIGYEIARLIKVLILYKGISPTSVHLIGHSLGGHAAGFAGKVTPNLGRITSLDACGLLFDDLPSCLKVTNTDAEFVDAIHTHGSSSLTEGLGTIIPYGDIDFYPNGGVMQPGCSSGNVYFDTNKQIKLVNTQLELVFCNHQRALYLFFESINECRFESVMCNDYKDFKDGKCPRETSVVSSMGFHAKKNESLPPNTPLYLETSDQYPFCLENV